MNICHIFIHSSVDRQLGCIHVLSVVNGAAMNVGVHVSFVYFQSFLDIVPEVRLLDLMVALFLVF